MSDTKEQEKVKRGTKQQQPYADKNGKVDQEEAKYALQLVQDINSWLEAREKHTSVFNGMQYSTAYVYNQKKAINFAPPRKEGEDRQLSFGLPHEKIVGFCSFFLKEVFKREYDCFDKDGKVIEGMGEIYNLAVEHSFAIEQFEKKIGYIYWETFTQGDAYVVDEWEVKTITKPKAKNGDKEITRENMDFSYEFLDNLTFEAGEEVQTRMAKARLLDGRMVILSDPECTELQDQEGIAIEEDMSTERAEQIFGTMKRWNQVPDNFEDIKETTTGESMTLFDNKRLKDPKKRKLVHYIFKKEENKMNVMINGVMMLHRDTPMTVWHPRGNYPISQFKAEKMTGSAYSRSIPMKTKFNSDYIDWALMKLSEKFEQGIDPALLVNGKYTLTKDLFKAGQRTHGISSGAYEKADPENKGLTSQEFSFVQLMKEIIESQTLNQTTTGEIADNTTATAINSAQSNQLMKLGYLLDGIVNGYLDMALRRAETVESKYTTKRRETLVDGKSIPVFQSFTVDFGGARHIVEFDESVGEEGQDAQKENDALFEKSFKDKSKGKNNEYHRVNPKAMRNQWYTLLCKIKPERKKDTYLQIMELREEFGWLQEMFGDMLNREQAKKEYLDITGRPSKLFLPQDVVEMNKLIEKKEQQATGAQDMSGAGVKKALHTNAQQV